MPPRQRHAWCIKPWAMKKVRDPSASLEHEVIYAVVALYAGLCTFFLSIHFLQPDRAKAKDPVDTAVQAATVEADTAP